MDPGDGDGGGASGGAATGGGSSGCGAPGGGSTRGLLRDYLDGCGSSNPVAAQTSPFPAAAAAMDSGSSQLGGAE